MTIQQFLILGWTGLGVLAIFGICWIYGLFTDLPRIRFFCDVMMVAALFMMLIGFGGRAKQLRLAQEREAAIIRQAKAYDQTGAKLLKQLTTVKKQTDGIQQHVAGKWQQSLTDYQAAVKAQQKKKKRSKKLVYNPSKVVGEAMTDKSKSIKSCQKELKAAGKLLGKLYQQRNNKKITVPYQDYSAALTQTVKYYNSAVTVNKLTCRKYVDKNRQAAEKTQAALAKLDQD